MLKYQVQNIITAVQRKIYLTKSRDDYGEVSGREGLLEKVIFELSCKLSKP